ncbi:hypothetical protein [Pseudoalteromonas rubra]|uniref:hypothetical protein n=1 Tax=Pseudoalteromonas rubra TaxID=43658 RepID=UPI0013DE64D1|nr:hypothetical protein [Pseudoalteromonas rubra]
MIKLSFSCSSTDKAAIAFFGNKSTSFDNVFNTLSGSESNISSGSPVGFSLLSISGVGYKLLSVAPDMEAMPRAAKTVVITITFTANFDKMCIADFLFNKSQAVYFLAGFKVVMNVKLFVIFAAWKSLLVLSKA